MKVWIRSNIEAGSSSNLANNYFDKQLKTTGEDQIHRKYNEPLYIMRSSIRIVESGISTIEFLSDLQICTYKYLQVSKN